MIELDRMFATAIIDDATLVGLGVTGAFRGIAPEGTEAPYVVFFQSSAITEYANGGARAKKVLYTIKAVDAGDDQTRANEIDARLKALLTDNLGLDASLYKVIELRPISDVDYIERTDGITYQHVGAVYRVHLAV